MTNFTEGEWSITEVGGSVWIDDDQGFSIAQVYDCKGAINNAPLFKQAPAMYAALETHLKVLDDLYPSDVNNVDAEHVSEFMAVHGLILETKALLTKARGE